MTRGRVRAWPRTLAAALAAAAVLGGCGVDGTDPPGGSPGGAPGGDSQDRSQQIAAVSDAVYDAMGVRDSRVAFAYGRQASSACATELDLPPGLEDGQAWYADQAFTLSPGTYDDDALLDGAARHFAAEGYQTQLYRKSTLRALTAVKGDVGVVVTGPPLQVSIAAGPCGPNYSRVGSGYVPETG